MVPKMNLLNVTQKFATEDQTPDNLITQRWRDVSRKHE
jgi:hypothetical protein